VRLYFIAGEASGDMHGAELVHALRQQISDGWFRAWGGDHMEAAGCQLVRHYREMAYMGFSDLLRHTGKIADNWRFVRQDILQFKPHYLFLIDYSGFNLPLARWARGQGIPCVYYILPQLWAWRAKRAKALGRDTVLRLGILPFEETFYQQLGIAVHYVGHPLVSKLRSIGSFQEERKEREMAPKPIALLPGSRMQEIRRHIPLLLPLVQRYPKLTFEWVLAPGLPPGLRREIEAQFPANLTFSSSTVQTLQRCGLALVSSGTATLEAALLQVPQVVFYRPGLVNYLIARGMLRTKHISLVNNILNSSLLPEIVHPIAQVKALDRAFRNLLDPKQQERQRQGYLRLTELLGNKDAAAEASNLFLMYKNLFINT